MQTNEEKTAIATDLRDYIAKTGLSAAKVAVQMGISAALISNMLSGKWEQISEEKWLAAAALAKPKKGWAIVSTTNLETIQNIADHCAQNGQTRCVIGASGTGKTTALTYYVRKPGTKHAYYVLAQESMTRKEFLESILEAMGVEFYGTLNKMIKRVASELCKHQNALLMIDDAGKLSGSKLHVIQQLIDLVHSRAGILIAATDYFYDNLMKGSKKGLMGYPELETRIGYKQPLAAPSLAEKRNISQANCIGGIMDEKDIKIAKDFRSLYNSIQTHNFTSKKEGIQ